MTLATLSSKGQITIPKEIREQLGLRTGDRVSFISGPDGRVVIQAKKIPFEQVMGMLKRSERKPVTVDEMDEGIKAYVRLRFGSRSLRDGVGAVRDVRLLQI